MKRLIGVATLILVTALTSTSYADNSKTFTLTGEWIFNNLKTPAEKQTVWDTQPTTISILRLSVDDQMSPDQLVLATGAFTDGKVMLEGEIEARINVQISVTRGEEEPMTLAAVLVPGENTSFALWDRDNSFPGVEDELLVVGDFKIVEESDAKFTIFGDLSSMIDKDLSIARAYLGVRSSSPLDGSVLADRSNAVLLKDGRFSIEGICNEPLLVSVWVHSQVDVYSGMAYLVVEPGARIRISPSASSSSFAPGGRASELLADSEIKDSTHSKIVESWQNSEAYLKKLDEYAEAIELAAQKATSDSTPEDEQTETAESEQQPAKTPYEVHTEMTVIKNSVLTPIAQNLDEPILALLALELGTAGRALENWDKIATVLDKDMVARRVSPQRDALEKQIRVAENAKKIVPGHTAPEFTLENLTGEDVALYDVLADNKVVLLDFWASWCGPCIAKFPKLIEMHTTYKDDGFEILLVSIDDTYEDWKKGSEAHEVPGINVGDLNGWTGETPVDYGVTWIPTEFLIDSDGEILNKSLTTDELEEFLDERFGGKTKQKDDNELNSDEDEI